jgi:hypothetical protein
VTDSLAIEDTNVGIDETRWSKRGEEKVMRKALPANHCALRITHHILRPPIIAGASQKGRDIQIFTVKRAHQIVAIGFGALCG